jgi:hypothetical protein
VRKTTAKEYGAVDQREAHFAIRLPGFLIEEEIGLGEAIKRVTYSLFGTKSCGGCEKRAAALNRWIHFSK